MPDFFAVHDAAKVRVLGRAELLDALRQPAQTLAGRLAPDELILVGEPGEAGRILEDVEAQLGESRAACLVVDHTDGWSLHSLVGDDVGLLFRMAADWKLPALDGAPAFTVGSVFHCAGKLFVRPGRIDVLTGTEVRPWVDHELEHLGHHVGAHRVDAPATAPVGVGTKGVEVA